MIVVFGGTGNIGRPLVAALKERGAEFRIVSRDPAKAAGTAGDGAEIVQGDVEQPDSYTGALEGAEAVFLLTPQHPRQEELQNAVVDAAARAGVKRIVKLSGGSAVTKEDSPSWVGRAHAANERKIRESGLAWTILRPNYFFQNLLAMADPIKNGTLPVPWGDAKAGVVDARDVGEAAAAILVDGAGHEEKVYEPTGPESLSMADVAERLSRVLGREIKHVSPPIEAVQETFRGRGAPDWLVQHIGELMGVFATGAGDSVTQDVERILGRPPRSVDDFARDHAQAFAP